jgi:hypothetical protein
VDKPQPPTPLLGLGQIDLLYLEYPSPCCGVESIVLRSLSTPAVIVLRCGQCGKQWRT